MDQVQIQVQAIVRDSVGTIETVLNRSLDNVYISTTIKVLIGLYAAFAAPKLPPSLVDLMDNILVRVAFAFVIVLTATRDPSIALMIAIAFIVTLQTANKFRLMGTELSVSAPGQTSWLPSAKREGFYDQTVDFQNPDTPEEAADMPEEAVDMPEEAVDMPEEADDTVERLTRRRNVWRPSGEQKERFTDGDDQDLEGAGPEYFTDNLSPHFQAKRPEDLQAMKGSNLTGNIESNPTAVFTSNTQFHDVQSNNVEQADQKSCFKSMANQHCTQGLSLNTPSGV
tara:strand:+ start:235 stop:1083 length:849 start_codon:yes stop_codon:yes gene_type:complete